MLIETAHAIFQPILNHIQHFYLSGINEDRFTELEKSYPKYALFAQEKLSFNDKLWSPCGLSFGKIHIDKNQFILTQEGILFDSESEERQTLSIEITLPYISSNTAPYFGTDDSILHFFAEENHLLIVFNHSDPVNKKRNYMFFSGNSIKYNFL